MTSGSKSAAFHRVEDAQELAPGTYQLKGLTQAGPRALLYIIVGGGIVAGSIGMLSFYGALKGAPLTKVMPIAFTSPMFGAALAVAIGGEPLTLKTIVGMLMTVGGIILLTVG